MRRVSRPGGSGGRAGSLIRILAMAVPVGVLLLVVLLTDAGDASAASVEAYDATRDAGLEFSGNTYGATIADLDADGDEDLLEVRHYFRGGPTLFENLGGGAFADRGSAFGISGRTDFHGCDVADVNQDGRADVYCALGGKKGGTAANAKRLYLAQPQGGYVDVAEQWGVQDEFGRGREVSFIDADGDEYPDLFVGNNPKRMDGQPSPNRFFLNDGGERFVEQPGFGLNGRYGADFDAQAVDYDRDGFEDLLVCSPSGVHLFRNRSNRRFEDVSDRTGHEGGCKSAELAQLGGDRDLDLAVLGRDRLEVRIARPGGFARAPAYERSVENARALAVGDVDADGLGDIYVVRHGRYVKDAEYDHRDDTPDLMLRNRRSGTRFTRLAVPPIRRGVGQSVIGFDHDADGRDAFLVMNGFNKAEGPIKLIAFRDALRGG